MEETMVQNRVTSCKISRHNTHLLEDQDNDEIMRDSLEIERPQTSGTHSSEESRLIDGSPNRDNEDSRSDGSIETEKKYQEDLKERVKRSFAELGLNADDPLSDSILKSVSPSDSLEDPLGLIDDLQDDDQRESNLEDSLETMPDNKKHDSVKPATALSAESNRSESHGSLSGSHHRYSDNPISQVVIDTQDAYEPLREHIQQQYHQYDPAQLNQNNSAGPDIDIEESDNETRHPQYTDHNQQIMTSREHELNTTHQNKINSQDSWSGQSNYGSLHSRKGSSHANNTFRNSTIESAATKPSSGIQLGNSPRSKSMRSPFSDPSQDQKEASVPNQESSSHDTHMSQLVETLPYDETVRVEYISDDSGDDDEHYVDEKGSPIHFDEPPTEPHHQQYRIKPRPPASPLDATKQAIKLRRYAVERQQSPQQEDFRNITTNDQYSGEQPNHVLEESVVIQIADTEGLHEGTIANPVTPNHNDKSAKNQSDRKCVDAESYAMIQLKAQQKIRSREVSADRQSVKGKVRQHHQNSSSSKKKTSGKSSRMNYRAESIERRRADIEANNTSPLKDKNIVHDDKTKEFDNHMVEAQSSSDRRRSDERVHSIHQRQLKPDTSPGQKNDYGSQLSHNYQGHESDIRYNEPTPQVQPSALPLIEPSEDGPIGHQQHLIHNQPPPNNPACPIQPAYPSVPVQQMHYQQSGIPYQNNQQNQIPYNGNPQPYSNRPQLLQYQPTNQNQMYQSNQIPVHHQHQLPSYTLNQGNQHGPLHYQGYAMMQMPGQGYQQMHGHDIYSESRLNVHQSQSNHGNQQQIVSNQDSFHLHNSQVNNMQGLYQQLQQQSFQSQIYQPHPPQHGVHDMPQDLHGMQQHHQPVDPVYQIQPAIPQGVPPLDLRSLDEDQHVRNNPPPENISSLVSTNNGWTPSTHVTGPQPQADNSTNSPPVHQIVPNKQTLTQNTVNNKPKVNFIEQNKTKLRKEFPQKRYLDMYARKDMNLRKPLPNISRENSEDHDDQWALQVNKDDVNERTKNVVPSKHVQLPRQQSDTAVRYSRVDLTDVLPSEQFKQDDYPQSAPVHYHGNKYEDNGQLHRVSSPPLNARNSQSKFVSFSADHATSYAHMQYRPKINYKAESSTRSSFSRPGPYTVLPNIQKYNNDVDELHTSDTDGYLAKMQKSRQAPQYKQYTLKDYQKLKTDIKLGGLGPNTEVQEKQEKVSKQREYAKQVKIQNRKAFQQQSRSPGLPQRVSPQVKVPTKRHVAIEYSKKIPKPRLPTPPEEKHEQMYGTSIKERIIDSESQMRELEELQLRHEKEKVEVEKIKKDIRT